MHDQPRNATIAARHDLDAVENLAAFTRLANASSPSTRSPSHSSPRQVSSRWPGMSTSTIRLRARSSPFAREPEAKPEPEPASELEPIADYSARLLAWLVAHPGVWSCSGHGPAIVAAAAGLARRGLVVVRLIAGERTIEASEQARAAAIVHDLDSPDSPDSLD